MSADIDIPRPVRWRMRYVAGGSYSSVMAIEVTVTAKVFFEAQLLAEREIHRQLPFGEWKFERGTFDLGEVQPVSTVEGLRVEGLR